MSSGDHSGIASNLFTGRLVVAAVAEKTDRSKSRFAGLKCTALKDDGTICNTVISSYTVLPCQFCMPCYSRYMRRGLKPPIEVKNRKKRGLSV
ncbi:hypothetical protein HZC53_00380 [Candidatus Uhrbacteria bacterium]|nr:hypothetical protein [Candidatus Uhrbacteria bacterium]